MALTGAFLIDSTTFFKYRDVSSVRSFVLKSFRGARMWRQDYVATTSTYYSYLILRIWCYILLLSQHFIFLAYFFGLQINQMLSVV